MKIATWNVNSVRVREERLVRWLGAHAPDVLCLQELKTVEANFPHAAVSAAGYHAALHGQKTYNGVAILSRTPAEDVRCGLPGDPSDLQARLVSARVGGVRVFSAYFPNGGEMGSEKWVYKLGWMARLAAHLREAYDPSEPLALCGDFNVAPDDTDVTKPAEWADTVLCHPEVRAALQRIADFGLVDLVRQFFPGGGPLTWWDYRGGAFHKDDGLRIDHLFVTRSLAAAARGAGVDREERKGVQPSDHAPVWAEFEGL